MASYFDLSGQTALVTGALSGIGAATAVVLAEMETRVALGYHQNRQGAESVVERIRAARGGGGGFLASRAASFIVGEMIDVNGGQLMQ